MSYRSIRDAEVSLDVILVELLKLNPEQAERLSEAVSQLARAVADDEIDRLFNRGDYR